MATFANTTSPTPFGSFDDDTQFQSDADKIVTFVKRKLGDDILSVELTKKQIWANFEEAMFEYSNLVNQYQTKSQLNNFLGLATGSMSGSEQKHPRENLEFLGRFAEPYATEAGIGGSYNMTSGSIQLVKGQQDYDIYTDLKDAAGNAIFTNTTLNPHRSKMRIREVFHFNPTQAYRFFDTTSAINYLNNEFSFESFTPETIFYVLPVFEDILRAGQLKVSQKVRRSNYSYQIIGTKIRVFPKPTQNDPKKMFMRVSFAPDPLRPAFSDATTDGVSNMSNIPFGNLSYSKINSMAKQWIRQYTLALSKELLGLIRSKFGSVPIPGGDLQLNGSDLVSAGKTEKDALISQLREMLDSMTYDKIVETDAARAESVRKQLSMIPMPNGKAIIMG
tara:strand:- start:2847 stop:4019 length:1173 start_codon:yes stop_codon:yes gene_type:complete